MDHTLPLQALLDGFPAGLLLLDAQGKVILTNQALMTMLSLDATIDPVGRYYWEVMRDVIVFGAIKSLSKDLPRHQLDVVLGGRTYGLDARYLLSEGVPLILLVFTDLTEVRALEKIKKDLVSNVSHELRTPLTALQGFIETLEEELPEEFQPYVTVIKNNTTRLKYIVEDLLTLSELEASGDRLERGVVPVQALLDTVLPLFRQRIEQKKLHLQLEIQDPTIDIRGDIFRLEQVMINLLDNAVKYTETGTITVRCRKENSALILEVADTGLGLSTEQQQRMFDRFYVVDKARSRQTGGTGLGLSIVKHIVLLHQGRIDVESAVGNGTCVRISLPF
jgi:two-component system phosphate regulon sensor histidine kinase PhoR